MFQNVEGLSVVLSGVTLTTRAMSECLDSCADGIHGYMLVGINATKTTDEVAHIEVEGEDERR